MWLCQKPPKSHLLAADPTEQLVNSRGALRRLRSLLTAPQDLRASTGARLVDATATTRV
jgi:hypothetical protein